MSVTGMIKAWLGLILRYVGYDLIHVSSSFFHQDQVKIYNIYPQ